LSGTAGTIADRTYSIYFGSPTGNTTGNVALNKYLEGMTVVIHETL
jgi:hypothetical protein